jgi:hypothetical protein
MPYRVQFFHNEINEATKIKIEDNMIHVSCFELKILQLDTLKSLLNCFQGK